MDQYPFLFELYFRGVDVDEFITLLKQSGYKEQAKTAQMQFDKQLKELQPNQSTELSMPVVGQSLPNEDTYSKNDVRNAFKCGEIGHTYHFKDGKAILPKNYEGVEG